MHENFFVPPTFWSSVAAYPYASFAALLAVGMCLLFALLAYKASKGASSLWSSQGCLIMLSGSVVVLVICSAPIFNSWLRSVNVLETQPKLISLLVDDMYRYDCEPAKDIIRNSGVEQVTYVSEQAYELMKKKVAICKGQQAVKNVIDAIRR